MAYWFVLSPRNQRGRWFDPSPVRIPLDKVFYPQIIVSLNPGVLNGYLAGFFPQNAPALVKWLQELKPG